MQHWVSNLLMLYPMLTLLAQIKYSATLAKAMINLASKSSGSGVETYAQMAASGSATDPIKKALDQNKKAKDRAASGKTPDPSLIKQAESALTSNSGWFESTLSYSGCYFSSRSCHYRRYLENVHNTKNDLRNGLDPGDVLRLATRITGPGILT